MLIATMTASSAVLPLFVLVGMALTTLAVQGFLVGRDRYGAS